MTRSAKRCAVGLLLSLAVTVLVVPAAAQQPPVGASADDKHVTAWMGGRVVMRYRKADVPFKPYLEELFTPSGVNVLRDSPADHKHHHGLMFAVAVDGVNFWEEGPDAGAQRSRSVAVLPGIRQSRQMTLLDLGGLDQTIDWVGPKEDRPLLHERRTVQAFAAPRGTATLVMWQSHLSLPAGRESATISGADYFGLGMRFPVSMDKGGRFRNADGKTGVPETNAQRSRWCAYSAEVDGKPVTVAMFDRAENYRHPATWFTMEKPFAYLCATLNLKKEPVTLKAGEPLVLRYAVAAWDGTVDAAEIEALYKRWAAMPIGARSPASRPAKQ